jgi:hypothetical protein
VDVRRQVNITLGEENFIKQKKKKRSWHRPTGRPQCPLPPPPSPSAATATFTTGRRHLHHTPKPANSTTTTHNNNNAHRPQHHHHSSIRAPKDVKVAPAGEDASADPLPEEGVAPVADLPAVAPARRYAARRSQGRACR